MSDATVILIIGLICVMVGLVSGLLLGRTGGTKTENSSLPPGTKELARLWRNQRTGRLHVEVDGQVFRSIDEVNDARRKFLIQVYESLRSWLGEAAQTQADRPSVPAAVARSEESNVANAAPLPPTLSQTAPARFSSPGKTPVGQPKPNADPQRASLNPFGVFANVLRPVPKHSTLPNLSIVAQIDEILQDKLNNFPAGGGQKIRLAERSDQGMMVVVGMQEYQDIDSVPDPAIRDLLKQCVAEWERR